MIISEKWIKNRLQIESEEEIALLSTLSLPGVQNKGKIGHLGVALQNFVNLKIINLDRNALDSLDGLQFCKRLEKLTVYHKFSFLLLLLPSSFFHLPSFNGSTIIPLFITFLCFLPFFLASFLASFWLPSHFLLASPSFSLFPLFFFF